MGGLFVHTDTRGSGRAKKSVFFKTKEQDNEEDDKEAC